MSQWKITSQKSIFKAKLLDIQEIVLKSKDGKEKVHHVAERTPTVSVFPLTDANEIYLIYQYRQMLKKRTLEAVAGYIEKKENTLQAAKRELREETGITAMQWEEIARVEMAASVFKGKMYLFLATDLEFGPTQLDEGEEITLVKMPLLEAVKKVMTGEIDHSHSMIGILMLDKLRMQRKQKPSKL